MVNNPAEQNETQETDGVLTRENVRTAIKITTGALSLTLAALVYKYVQYIEIVVDLPIKERRRFDKFFKECPQAKPLLDKLAQDVVSKKEYDKLVKRVDDFIVYCPNFADDDVLTHKYEFIKNIILKRLGD